MQSQPIHDSNEARRLAATRVQSDRDATNVQANDLERLKQLIQTLRSLAASLPAELQGLVAGLIAEAEAALASGDPISVGRLINKLEEVLAMLQDVIRALAKGDAEAASQLVSALIAKLLGAKKAKDKMIRQQEASMEASLEAMMNQMFKL